jgi:FixJ family two-component response regulator
MMMEGDKFMVIWDTDDEEKMANKIAFMLPEVRYKVIPIMDTREFLKQYLEIKRGP